MTLLFGSIVVFCSLFAAFVLLCFFWQYRRAHQLRGVLLEYDEAMGAYRGVPKMWEVSTQDEPSGGQRSWGSVRPLSVDDVERAPEPTTPPTSLPRRSLRDAFRRSVQPPPQATAEGLEAAASVPMSSLRMTFIIAMPCAEPPNRRQSTLSQGTSVNGSWGHREYAIGIHHAPFREGGPL